MTRNAKLWLACFCMQALLAQAACAQTSLIVSAAASLKDSLTEIAAAYGKIESAVSITCNFGGSGVLQQQIENGAPVDVFIPAASKQMDGLEKAGLLLPVSRRNLLRNELVLIAAKTNSQCKDFA